MTYGTCLECDSAMSIGWDGRYYLCPNCGSWVSKKDHDRVMKEIFQIALEEALEESWAE